MLDSSVLLLTSPLVLLGRCWVEGGIFSCHQMTELNASVIAFSTAVTFLDPTKVGFLIRLVTLTFSAVQGTGMALHPSLGVGCPT